MPVRVVDGNDSDDWPVPPMRGTPGFGPQGVAPTKPRPPDARGPRTRVCVTLEERDADLKDLEPRWRAVLRHQAHSAFFLSPRCYEIVDGVEMDPSAEMFQA